MPKTITINKCSQCPFCYDNGVDIHCAECEKLGLESVFPKNSFSDFPGGCPLADATPETIDFINKRIDDIMGNWRLSDNSKTTRL